MSTMIHDRHWSFAERKLLRGFLLSDLYKNDARRDEEWWHSPLSWFVRIERVPNSSGLTVWVVGPRGELFAHSSQASLSWLAEVLP